MTGEHKNPHDSDLTHPHYLGDGVYAWWDGSQVWLAVNAHHNRPVVALDGHVIDNLVKYDKERRNG